MSGYKIRARAKPRAATPYQRNKVRAALEQSGSVELADWVDLRCDLLLEEFCSMCIKAVLCSGYMTALIVGISQKMKTTGLI